MNFGKGSDDTSLKIDKTIIKPSKEQKPLGISIDNNLSFKDTYNRYAKRPAKSYMLYPESPTTWTIEK